MNLNWNFAQLNGNAVSRFYPIIYEERDGLLRMLSTHPDDFHKHLETFFGTIIMRTAYGFEDPEWNKSLIHDVEELIIAFGVARVPGRFLVNTFPILKHVPAWLPGAGFRKYFRDLAEKSRRIVEVPFKDAKERLEKGERSVYPSMAASLIDRLPSHNEPNRTDMETVARHVCAVTYMAGTETTLSSAHALILALANNPEVQIKAQAEIDMVVGSERLPLISDRPSLPYVHAIIKEIGRWFTVLPLSLPHINTRDDEYDGYFIPKGTLISPNNWAMMHDPSVFDKPFDFIPERYLTDDGNINTSVPDANADSDLLYLEVLGQGMLILGSHRRAVDLLEKRAAIYSDRPTLALTDLMDFHWNFAIQPYGPWWRLHRRDFHQQLNSNVVSRYHPIMYEEREGLLRMLSTHPDDFHKHMETFFGTIIMRTAYGFEDAGRNKSFINNAEELIVAFGAARIPGRFLVNTFPILKHVPAWLPGAGFRRYFQDLAEKSRRSVEIPFRDSKERLEKGERSVYPSMAAALIDRLPGRNEPNRADMETVARNVCAIAYTAGAETTLASAHALILALANHPEVQIKAQAEIDTVVGLGRLPLISDRPSLPYVHAIIKEIGRWFTVAPLNTPRVNTRDDEYDGYFIPKGTLIFTNSWAMMHNPTVFDKPFDFIPERYLTDDGKINMSVPDAKTAAFGFGRRICPGRQFSSDTIFVMAASLLATFSIFPPKDEKGNRPPLKLEVKSQNLA
ncbi:hypothetical protein EST38_g6411 [Candolleomyces aberdarensis]|uniref:Cytochrome P450 n=1 Tax=Candolleomyces aberdarensis TaxID=2316362 RepID=A0A4Q2DL19_9AGAR|nr:hypothetical protein EST38_g6411 [Candolleomyces aberdarensis]